MSEKLSCKKTFCAIPWKEPFVTSHGHYDLCALEIETIRKEKIYLDTDLPDYWNNNSIKEIRKKMLEGISPPECRLCKQDEENGCVSQRQRRNIKYIKSHEPSGENDLFNALVMNTNSDGGVKEIDIQGIHFAVGKTCQLGCVSCSSFNSSFLEQEEKKYPNLKIYKDRHNRTVLHKQMNSKDMDLHLYTMLKKNIKRLDHLHVTGGEPFLSKKFFEFIDWCVENDHLEKTLYIQTNGVTHIDAKSIEKLKKFKELKLYISCDAIGELEEYVRFPTDWKSKIECIDNLILHFQDITLNATIHALNVVGLADLIRFSENKKLKIWLHFLGEPSFLQIKNADPKTKKKALSQLSILKGHESKFSPWLKNQLDIIDLKLHEKEDSEAYENVLQIIKLYQKIRKKDYFELISDY